LRLNENFVTARSGWFAFALISLVAASFFVLRVSAPPNLLDQDQERPAAYVLDAVKNGNWICQRDLAGEVTSKPPLFTWSSAVATLIAGRISEFSLYLPGAIAAFATAWLLFGMGRNVFGHRAALTAALISMLTTAAAKQFGLARTDGVFTFTVALTALLAFRAWNSGGTWIWFWLAAAVATLAKGPLGLVLGGAGLIACFWERKSGEPQPIRGSHWAGIALFILIAGGWFLMAYLDTGQAIIDKMLGKELAGHAFGGGKRRLPGSLFWQPPLYYLGRAAPWSLFAYYGFWRLWKHPALDAAERRFERFLFCWFFAGLILFSISPHQRGDLLWPILPAGALIAGRELARLTRHWSLKRLHLVLACSAAVALGGFTFYYGRVTAQTSLVKQTVALRQMAAEIERAGGPEFPLTHVDSRMTLQIYLNTLRPQVSPERAAELLRGTAPAYVAVKDLNAFEMVRTPEDPPWFTLLPKAGNTDSPVRIISNRPQLEPGNGFAFCFGTLFVRANGARLQKITRNIIAFESSEGGAEIVITNESTEPRRVKLRLAGRQHERVLAGGESWRVREASD
jgi:4-amino-4-deoxy-L-arabinose transferase-like glycosyltransferase